VDRLEPPESRLLLLTLSYDGTDFSGWQRQPKVRTVQALLEAALSTMEHRDVRVRGASRTDAGVHALGQVAAHRTRSRIPLDGYLKGLGALLPKDVSVTDVRRAPDHFDIRHWPCRKLYRYTSLIRDPFLDRYALRLPRRIDERAMAQASSHLVGTHDFSTFKASDPAPKSPIRTIDSIAVLRSGNIVTIDVQGRSFLKYMVRSIAGTLLQVGRGSLAAQKMAVILESRDRAQAGPTAPAKGLCLLAVAYDGLSPHFGPPCKPAVPWPPLMGPLARGPAEPVPCLPVRES